MAADLEHCLLNDPSAVVPNVSVNKSQQYHPVQYSLLYDLYTVFTKCQSISQSIKSDAVRLEGALLLSKRYKAAIKRAIKMLEQPEMANDECLPEASSLNLGEELCSVQLLWSLIEAVTIRPSHNLITIDLLEWARECFPSAQSLIPSAQEGRPPHETSFLGSIMESLIQQEKSELHDSYWNAVIRQAICADFESVASLLQFHSEYRTDDNIVKIVKIANAANAAITKQDRTNCDEFLALQKKVRDFADQRHISRLNDNLGVICSLLIGDRGTFRKYFDLFRPRWFEVLPAFLLFFYPSASGAEMSKVVESMFSLLGLSRVHLSKIEKTVLAILELDVIGALKLICAAGHSLCWFAVHLVDLLNFHDPTYLNPDASTLSAFQSKFLFRGEPTNEMENVDLRSRLLLEYAQLIFQDIQLWEIGADYLMASDLKDSREILDRIVSQFNWHGNVAIAERLLTICERYGLQSSHEDILRAITLKFCRIGEWSTALSWALRMQNKSTMAAHVAKRILQGAVLASHIGKMRVFESMADEFVGSAELLLLFKFYTFKRYLHNGNLKQAVQLLHELFLDNSSPTEFHVALSEEMARLLATFQRELIYMEAAQLPSTNQGLPGLDRDSVQDMFRALSMFQLQQNLLKAASTGEKEQQKSVEGRSGTSRSTALFPESTLPNLEVYERLTDLVQTLRPMLAEALASSSLS